MSAAGEAKGVRMSVEVRKYSSAPWEGKGMENQLVNALMKKQGHSSNANTNI